MFKELFSRLFWCFVISFSVSMAGGFIVYQQAEGFDAKQGSFILFLVSLLLSFFNFILSIPALLNLNKQIRENFVFSFLSFFLLPVAFLGLVARAVFSSHHPDAKDFVNLLPNLVFCLALAYHFYRFRAKNMPEAPDL